MRKKKPRVLVERVIKKSKKKRKGTGHKKPPPTIVSVHTRPTFGCVIQRQRKESFQIFGFHVLHASVWLTRWQIGMIMGARKTHEGTASWHSDTLCRNVGARDRCDRSLYASIYLECFSKSPLLCVHVNTYVFDTYANNFWKHFLTNHDFIRNFLIFSFSNLSNFVFCQFV